MEFEEMQSDVLHDVEIELLAQLVEAKAKTVEEAVKIIRSAKTTNQKKGK